MTFFLDGITVAGKNIKKKYSQSKTPFYDKRPSTTSHKVDIKPKDKDRPPLVPNRLPSSIPPHYNTHSKRRAIAISKHSK